MKIEEFALERIQSLHENEVELNLSDSGVHPYDLRTLLSAEERESLLDIELGYGHTHGSPVLREAIAGLYANRTADEVIVTTGGIEANFLLVMTLVAPGDRVVVLTPNYLQIAGWARAAGGDVHEVPLDGGNDWSLDRQRLEEEIVSGTRLVTLCVPNNPTGTVLSDEDRNWLVDRCAQVGAWLHVDEVYKGSEMDGDEPPSWADAGPHVLVSNSTSKALALPGLRLGWLVGPAAQIYAAWQRKDYTTITASALSEAIAVMVLEPERRAKILERSRAWLRGNRDLLGDWVVANDAFDWVRPTAGGMGFVSYDLPIGSDALSERMRVEESTLIVPGTCYGLDGHFRVGIGAPPAVLEQGLVRVAALAARIRAAA